MSKGYLSVDYTEVMAPNVRNIKKGDVITCPHCGKKHTIKPADDGDDSLLCFYNCGKKTYLAGLHNRSMIDVFENRKQRNQK